MAVDKLINETQGNDIIDRLDDIASNLENVAAIIPAKFGMGLATCDTAADTAAKTCTIPNFALTNGAPVSVKFTYSNSASNATLNINGTGAKPMYYKGNPLGSSVISAGDIATFVYSSTGVYHIINIDTLTGAGTGTVTQIGGTGGITTNQTSGAPIQHDGNVKLNLKSDTAYTGTVADPSTDASVANGNVYPVALDGDGHPVVGVPWTDTTYENKSASEGGTDVSLVTTGDKYVWDHKLDATANAASAAKLNNGSADYAVGSATKGVYFNNGVPTVMTYELNTNVPADAVFTDTIYTGTGAIGVDADTHVISAAAATTTTAGVVTLSDAIPSSGAVDTKAATEKAVADSISGKAIGANSSTANAIATFSGTDGKTLADSAVTIAKNATGVTDDDTKVPTSKAVKTYVDATATGISRYLGTIDAVNELSTSAKKGDFYIVSTAWTGVHVGDEIIAEKNSPAQTIDGTNWKLLHNEADTNTTYEFGSGTTNGSFSVTPSSTGTAQSVAVYGLKSAAYTESTDYATSSHVHGSITNDGKITDAGVALAEGDSLAIVDSSDSSKIKKTSETFDGATTTKALTQKGTFETFLQSHQTVKQDGVTGATVNRFGTCSIAAGTAAKTVSITTGTFALEAGARVTVKFSNANTASSPTLNVDSTGAKNIFHNGAQITTGTNKGLLAGTVDFIYDGTQYHLIGNYIDTNTTYSDFVGSGSSSAHGLVPDPGSTAGTSRFLCENGEWATPPAAGSHTHGNITNDGQLQTTDVSIATGDKLVITDSSDSNKIARASISFDGSSTSQALSRAGSWQTFVKSSSLGDAAYKDYVTSVTSGSTNLPTSKAVYNYAVRQAYDTPDKTSGSLDDIASFEQRVYCDSNVTGGPLSNVSMMVETIRAYNAAYDTQTCTVLTGPYAGYMWSRARNGYGSGWTQWYPVDGHVYAIEKHTMRNHLSMPHGEFIASSSTRSITIPITPISGDIVVKFGSLTSTATGTTCGVIINDGSNTIVQTTITRGTNVSATLSLGTSIGKNLILYPGSQYSSTSAGNEVVWSDAMVLTSEEYSRDTSFSAYNSPTNELSVLTEAIPRYANGNVSTATFSLADLAVGHYIVLVANNESGTNRYGASLYILGKWSSDTIYTWSVISEKTNTKVSSATFSNDMITLTFDKSGYKTIRMRRFF